MLLGRAASIFCKNSHPNLIHHLIALMRLCWEGESC